MYILFLILLVFIFCLGFYCGAMYCCKKIDEFDIDKLIDDRIKEILYK